MEVVVLKDWVADMCFCDPPYNVDYGAPGRAGSGATKKGRQILNDALGEGFKQFLYDASVNILTVTKGAVYVCMSSSELHTLQAAFRPATTCRYGVTPRTARPSACERLPPHIKPWD
jgi:hypothetical protein